MLPLLNTQSTPAPATLAELLTARLFVTFLTAWPDGDVLGEVECTLADLRAVTDAWRCGPACRYSSLALVADNCHTFVSRTFPANGDLFDALPEWHA